MDAKDITMIITTKDVESKSKITFHSFELHKVYKNLVDGDYYTLARISYNKGQSHYNCLLNLNTMKGNRMCDLVAKTNEFIEVDYTFKIDEGLKNNGFN